MQVFSSRVKKRGSKVKIDFSYISRKKVQTELGLDTKNGKIFTIAQWYPRMCVYDVRMEYESFRSFRVLFGIWRF
jgi:hypothetical protein